ncbi:MAG TPA: hypothetical protein VGK74_17420 [Symbiobacteriaceae bacterium]|jgi:hypothetical protein
MDNQRQSELNAEVLRAAWPDLKPDPQAMAQVTALMVAGLADPAMAPAAAPAGRAVAPAASREAAAAPGAGREAAAAPGEAHFRALTFLWAGALVAGYVAWPWLSDWFTENPVTMVVLAVLGAVCLLTPLLLPFLLQIEQPAPSHDEGGVSIC